MLAPGAAFAVPDSIIFDWRSYLTLSVFETEPTNEGVGLILAAYVVITISATVFHVQSSLRPDEIKNG